MFARAHVSVMKNFNMMDKITIIVEEMQMKIKSL
jgi:hypothetical protein